MSLDLTLLPFDHDSPYLLYSHTILFVKESAFMDAASRASLARPREVQNGFRSLQGDKVYSEHALDDYDRNVGKPCEGRDELRDKCQLYDAYGARLLWIRAHELLRELEGVALHGDHDAAVAAYIAALDPETRIALYWH